MNFSEYYIASHNGKSNCVVRSFCKLFEKEYDEVFLELCNLANELNISSFNEIEVFDSYLSKHDIKKFDYGVDVKIRDLELNNGNYVVFCWDKSDFYHMIPIIDKVIYDKSDECLDLYVISIYKKNEVGE